MTATSDRTFSASEQADQTISGKLDHLGDYVWSSIAVDTELTRDQLKSLFQDGGLSEEFLPPEPTPYAVFARARKTSERGSGARWYDISDPEVGRGTLWALQAEAEVDKGVDTKSRRAKLDEPICRVGFRTHDDSDQYAPNVISDAPEHPVVVTLMAEFQRGMTLVTKPDLTEMVNQSLRRMRRISAKREGHVYFVQKGHGETLRALRTVVHNLHRPGFPKRWDPSAFREPTPNYIRVSRVFSEPDAMDTLRQEARMGLEFKVKALREQVETFKGKNVRDATLNASIAEVQDMLDELALFEDICQMTADDLRSDAEALGQKLDEMLGVA